MAARKSTRSREDARGAYEFVKSRPWGEKPGDMTSGQGRWIDTGSVCRRRSLKHSPSQLRGRVALPAFIIPMRIKRSSMSVIVKPIAESKPGKGCFERAGTAAGPGR